MPTYDNIGLSQPSASTITKVVASVTHDRGSTTEHQEILAIGGAESSLEIARVMASSPTSTDYGVVVRIAEPSTTAAISSIAGRTLVDQNSTTWPVQVSSVAGLIKMPSTQIVQVSSVGGVVAVNQNSTAFVTQVSSVAGRVNVQQQSTAWQVQVSTVAGLIKMPSTQQVSVSNLSTTANISSLSGVLSRLHEDDPIPSTFISGQLSSAESTIKSAISTSKLSVYSFDFTVNKPTSITVRLLAGSTTEMWRSFFHSTAVSGGIAKTVTPPNYICRTASNVSLVLVGSTDVHYAISMYEG